MCGMVAMPFSRATLSCSKIDSAFSGGRKVTSGGSTVLVSGMGPPQLVAARRVHKPEGRKAPSPPDQHVQPSASCILPAVLVGGSRCRDIGGCLCRAENI